MKLLTLSDLKHFWTNAVQKIPIKISDLQDDIALGTHIADTDKHVTASDKQTWNTVTSKAKDSDVLHKTGNETKSGELTVTKVLTNNLQAENSSLTLQSRGTNKSCAMFNGSSAADGGGFWCYGKDSSNGSDCRLQIYNTSKSRYERVDLVNSQFLPTPSGELDCGGSSNKWGSIYATNYYYGNDNVEFSTKFVTTDTAQTVSGAKTFSDGIVLNSLMYFTNKSVTKGTIPQSTISPYRIYFGSGVNYANSLFNIDTSVSNTGAQALTLRSAENVVNGDDTRLVIAYDPNLTQPKYASLTGDFIPRTNNTYECGTNKNKWKSFNGVEPSALGMPDLDNGVDISSYITVAAGVNRESLYTPPANGWISVALTRAGGTNMAVMLKQGNFASSGHNIAQENGTTTCNAMLPVKGGVQVSINSALADGIDFAYFYPCLGNV